MCDLREMTTDINGKPIPVWQARIEDLYTAYAPFGEILSLVRALLSDAERERAAARRLIEYQEAYTSPARRSPEEQALVDAYYATRERDERL